MLHTADLSLKRRGTFFVHDKCDDATQCGRTRGQRQLWYEVQIDAYGCPLDENGFLIDNNAVQHYFEKKYGAVHEFKSCEIIALTAITDIRRLVGHDRCKRVTVEIRPGDFAGIVAEKNFDREAA